MFEKVRFLIKTHKTQIIIIALLLAAVLPLGDTPIGNPGPV